MFLRVLSLRFCFPPRRWLRALGLFVPGLPLLAPPAAIRM